jgi:hypothetical protein
MKGGSMMRLAWILTACLAFSATAQGLTVEEILSRHEAAKGGRAAWEAVTTLHLQGTYTAFSKTAPFTLDQKRPNLYRFETSYEGGRWVSVYDGASAWSIDPLAGHAWAVRSNLAEREVLQREADFDGPLLGQPAAEISLLGEENFDGEDCYKLKVLRGEAEETWYLSKSTFLEFARIAPTEDFGRPVAVGRTYFLDFRPVPIPGGNPPQALMLPHHVEKEYGIRHRVLEIQSVEVNPDLGANSFRFERSPALGQIGALAGSFDVQVETASFPGAPWDTSQTTADIVERFDGGLLETVFGVVVAGQPLEFQITFSHDRFRDLYLVTVFDTFTFRYDLLEGKFEEGQLIVSNQRTGTGQPQGNATPVNRMTFYQLGESGFKVRSESSGDGGETWNEDQRMTFTRRP